MRVRVPPWLPVAFITQGTLTYQLNEQDVTHLQLINDADLALAKKHGSEPLKITSTEVDLQENVFDHASAELAKHGLDAPSTELKKLLDVLQFKPRRLVKCGLAPPLKCTAKGDEAEEPEDVLVVEALSIEDKEADATLDDAALAAKLQAEEYGTHDVVLEAVTAKGMKLDANTLHALLRMLHCRPARFVKLGLVEDVKAARQAYKLGGRACAGVVPQQGRPRQGRQGLGPRAPRARPLPRSRRRLGLRGVDGGGAPLGPPRRPRQGLPRAPLALARGPRLPRQGPRPRSPVGQGRGRGQGLPRSPWGPPPPPPASPPPHDPRGCGRW